MRPSLNEATILPCGMETFLEAASRARFGGVELRIEKLEEFLRERSTTDLMNLSETYGLGIVSLNSIENFSLLPESQFRRLLERVDRIMRICSEIGCSKVVAVPSPLLSRTRNKDVIERTWTALRRMADLGAKYGTKVAFEFLGFSNSSIRTLNEAVKVTAELDNVGLVIDTFHFYISNSLLETLRRIPSEKIWIVHISDVADLPIKELTDSDRLLPSEGIIDLNSIIRSLEAMGYGGYISVELFNEQYWRQNPYEAAWNAMASLKRLGL